VDVRLPSEARITVPKLNRDPVASLRPWPVNVTLGSREWQIPALPAADWLSVLMTDELDPDDVFPGLLTFSDASAVEDLLASGDIKLEEMYDTVRDIIATATARQWWVGLRLILVARDSWNNVGAQLILQHVDAAQLSLAAWLDTVLLTVLNSMDPKDVAMFTMQLEAPPEGEELAVEDMEMSSDAFLSMG
jgi:hypothetical protein